MKKHSPNTFERIERLPVDGSARNQMMRALVDRYRDLQRIERRDPEQYKREVAQVELEDRILGMSREVRRASSEVEAESRKQELHDLVARLVDLRFANREARLKRLTETLAAEKERLQSDKRGRDAAVERHVAAALRGRGDGGGPGRRREAQPDGRQFNASPGTPPPPSSPAPVEK